MPVSASRSSLAKRVWARKPMATARRVSLFEREIRVKLSQAALDILFGCAEVLSEGQRQGDGYYGSTMITIDLARMANVVREHCDTASARRVAALVVADARVQKKAHEVAVAHAEKRAGQRLVNLDIDLNSRFQGSRVFIDLDVEGDVPTGLVVA